MARCDTLLIHEALNCWCMRQDDGPCSDVMSCMQQAEGRGFCDNLTQKKKGKSRVFSLSPPESQPHISDKRLITGLRHLWCPIYVIGSLVVRERKLYFFPFSFVWSYYKKNDPLLTACMLNHHHVATRAIGNGQKKYFFLKIISFFFPWPGKPREYIPKKIFYYFKNILEKRRGNTQRDKGTQDRVTPKIWVD